MPAGEDAVVVAFGFETEFVSIGSNDLIQYVMAASRDEPAVRSLYRPRDPAVLELIRRVVEAGRLVKLSRADRRSTRDAAEAAVLVFPGGDQLRGLIDAADERAVVLRSTVAGELDVPLEAVLGFTTGSPRDSRTEAETIAWEVGIETEACSEGGMDVTAIDDGDYIKVKDVDFASGATSFAVRVASASGGGAIELRLENENGTLIGTCAVPSTGADQAWATESCTVSGATGKHDLFLKFTGSGFNVNWWQFAGPGDPGEAGTGGTGGLGGTTGGSEAERKLACVGVVS